MKKRIVLKKWVENLIYIISGLALLVIVSECDKISTFLITHIIALVIFAGTGLILTKYGRDND